MKFSTLFFTLAALCLAASYAGAATLLAATYCQAFGLLCLAARD